MARIPYNSQALPAMSYSTWLRSIVDLSDKPSCKVVSFLSEFDALPYKSAEVLVQYAQYWCILSDFLYRNRLKQLSSDVEMLFPVEELDQKTDVYWFEVARACDKAAEESLQSIVQWMGILPVLAAKMGYAETGLELSAEILEKAMKLTKEAVGLCHYSHTVAASTCKYFAKAPLLMASIKKRYRSFRVVGCWIKGVQELRFSGTPASSCGWFEDCASLAAGEQIVEAAALLVDSIPILKSYAYVLKSITDGEKGRARGFARQCAKYRAKNPVLVGRVESLTAFADTVPPPIIPPEDSPLLKIHPNKSPTPPLAKGTSPLCSGLSLKLAQ